MTWVVDTGPLSHFAEAGWLSVLKFLAPEHQVMIPDAVEQEIRSHMSQHSHLRSILDAKWITTVELVESAELDAFRRYAQRLVGADGRNVGECGVLALAETRSWTAVLDDAAACKAAKKVPDTPIKVRRTLGLLCDAVNAGHLSCELVSELCDDLAKSEYRVPFEPGGFVQWARNNGAIQPPSGGAVVTDS